MLQFAKAVCRLGGDGEEELDKADEKLAKIDYDRDRAAMGWPEDNKEDQRWWLEDYGTVFGGGKRKRKKSKMKRKKSKMKRR